jgi:hypothetical protein
MGHADYAVLHRYVRLSSERDLGSLSDWSSFIVIDAAHDLHWNRFRARDV